MSASKTISKCQLEILTIFMPWVKKTMIFAW